MSAEIVLYGDSFLCSPYVFSAHVALSEKGIPFRYQPLALHEREQKTAAYVRATLTGRVPALQHDDFWLSESSAIDEYLEEHFPPPGWPSLFPADPRTRARARQMMAWLRSDLLSLREERPSETIFYPRRVAPLSERAQSDANQLMRVVDQLVPDGVATAFGNWSIADADLSFMLQRLVVNGDEISGKARTYAAAQWGRPSVRAFAVHPRDAFVAA
jgi:glutathione S-transferase